MTIAFVEFASWSTTTRLGSVLFTVAAVIMMIYAMLTGPLATADCLSRERREGTLGLLFLTPLRGTDVVLGKVSAASLDHLLGLFSLLPLLAIPFLLGGVSPAQVGSTVLGVFSLMLFSLAVGAWASSLCTDSRAALGLTLVTLLAITFGVPLFLELAGARLWFSDADEILALPCPLYTMMCCVEFPARGSAWKFWLNLAMLTGMSVCCLFIAIKRTSRAWHAAEPSRVLRQLQRWASVINKPPAGSSGARRRLLDFNPLAWLESRDRLQNRLIGVLLLLNTGFWVLLSRNSDAWDTSIDAMVAWSIITQYLLCLWIAIQAPRRLIDDRQSGALELVLCTDLSPREYVRGAMYAMISRFGRVVVYLLAFELLLVGVHLVSHGDALAFLKNSPAQLWLLSMVVFPLLAYAIAKVGLYEALVRRNSISASAHLVVKFVLLPWILFYGCLLPLDLLLRGAGGRPGITDTVAMTFWTATQLFPILFFLSRANGKLRRQFRVLVSEPGIPWWKRFLRTQPRQESKQRPLAAGN